MEYLWNFFHCNGICIKVEICWIYDQNFDVCVLVENWAKEGKKSVIKSLEQELGAVQHAKNWNLGSYLNARVPLIALGCHSLGSRVPLKRLAHGSRSYLEKFCFHFSCSFFILVPFETYYFGSYIYSTNCMALIWLCKSFRELNSIVNVIFFVSFSILINYPFLYQL